jgi:DNA polymerase
VDPKERLRRYLEQRREFGETELVLDRMTVDDVMRLLGDRPGPGPSSGGATDWRTALGGAPRAEDAPAARPSGPPGASRAAETSDSKARRPAPPQTASPTTSDALTSRASGTPTESPIRLDQVPGGLVVGAPLFDEAGPWQTLDEIATAVSGCRRCNLYKTAKHPVPGEGNPDADLVCVGEAPGATEDEQGRPFVGQAGQLLTKILGAIDLRREDVFICNVLKHRPPGNRNPDPDEVAACSPYLVRQIALLRPRVILALGTFAAQTLLQTRESIGKLRGRIHRYHGVPLIVTYHPAALLRNPAWKRPTWEDVQLARRLLDRSPAQ